VAFSNAITVSTSRTGDIDILLSNGRFGLRDDLLNVLVALYVDPTDGIIIELIVLHTARRDTM